MKKIKEALKKVKMKIVDNFVQMKKNPKLYLEKVISVLKKYKNNNKLFIAYALACVINGTLLRFFTMHTIENYLSIKPIIADLAIVLLIGAFGYLFKPRKRPYYYVFATVFFTAICLINSIYYTFYTSFASISMLSLTQFIAPVGDAIVENVIQIKDLIYCWAPIFIGLLAFKLKKQGYFQTTENKEKRKRRAFKALILSATFFCIFCMTLTGLDIGRFVKQWNREYIVMKFGIYTYQINDCFKSLEPKISSMFGYDTAMKNFREYYKDVSNTAKTNEYTNLLKGKNVIAIHAESIQSFAIGMTFNGQEVTPTLNRLKKEGMYFNNFYSQVSVGTSSDTELTLSTSLMPTLSGTAFVSYFDRTYVSIQNLLKEQGYYVFSMHANTADFWNRRIMHETLGYDRFYSKKDFVVTEENIIGLGLSDKEFFSQSIPMLEEISSTKKPFYGTYIMLTNHTPFSDTDKYGEFDVDIKEEFVNENGEVEVVSHPYMEGTKLGNYLKSLHYADEALGEFLDQLDANGLLENTVIVLYGDHDARLPKNDFVRLYNYDIETDDLLDKDDLQYINFDSYQYELNRKVPFIIWDKDQTLQGEVDDVMGMYDVMPTLGNLLGFYNKYQLGHDIFNIDNDNIVVFPNGNFVTNKVYYNSQKGAYLPLTNDVISEEYIELCNEYADDLLEVSNDIIVFDLIKKEEEINQMMNKVEGE